MKLGEGASSGQPEAPAKESAEPVETGLAQLLSYAGTGPAVAQEDSHEEEGGKAGVSLATARAATTHSNSHQTRSGQPAIEGRNEETRNQDA